jgi:hypothetical protein
VFTLPGIVNVHHMVVSLSRILKKHNTVDEKDCWTVIKFYNTCAQHVKYSTN